MRKLLATLLFVLAAHAAVAVDSTRLVDVIAQCETGAAWNGVPGRHGELSDWQITPEVWRQHMPGIAFAQARHPASAYACALKHVRWLISGLERNGYPVTPARVATAWNIGLGGILRRHGRPTAYGDRAANLYDAP